MSDAIPKELHSVCRLSHTIHAREAMDLTMGIRNIALGFLGEEVCSHHAHSVTRAEYRD